MATSTNPINKTTKFFINVTKLSYYFGMPYISIEEESPQSTKFSKFMYLYRIVTTIALFIFIVMELGSFFTQHHLTEKQNTDKIIFGMAHPIIFVCYLMNLIYKKDDIRSLIYNLAVVLKETYNDEEVEREMISKIKFFTTAYTSSFLSAVLLYGCDALIQVIRNALGGIPPHDPPAVKWLQSMDTCYTGSIALVIYVTAAANTAMVTSLSRSYTTTLQGVPIRLRFFASLPSTDATFTTVITAWPDVEDRSTAADCGRIWGYVMLWIYMVRLSGVYVLIFPSVICLSHQFKILQSYFRNLEHIFNENLSPIEKEQKYENSFKVGVELYKRTRWCVKQLQKSFGVTFSAQVVLSIHVLVFSMSQLVDSDRTLANVFSVVFTACSILAGTGLFMLNAGQITVQAEELAIAVYFSGWENCHLSSVRIKHLVVSTMRQAQEPEILWALSVMPLSYESYIKIVKSSYSVFSVLF